MYDRRSLRDLANIAVECLILFMENSLPTPRYYIVVSALSVIIVDQYGMNRLACTLSTLNIV